MPTVGTRATNALSLSPQSRLTTVALALGAGLLGGCLSDAPSRSESAGGATHIGLEPPVERNLEDPADKLGKEVKCVNDKTTEWLVVLDPERVEEMRPRLTAFGRVTHEVSRSVVFISGIGDFCTGDLAGVDGVVAVADRELPAEVLEQLDAKEAMWARAWVERRKPKLRPGDGLTWDAEGFEPPGPPQSEPPPENREEDD